MYSIRWQNECFFIELSEIITGKDLDKAVCSRKAGEARNKPSTLTK